MSTASELDRIAAMLGRLTGEDRQWILESLPVEAKTKLLERLDETRLPADLNDEPASKTPERWEQCHRELADAEPATMAKLLSAEPAWLVQSFMQIAEWPWRDAVLPLLPAATRVELTRGNTGQVKLGQPAREFLLCAAAEKLRARTADPENKSQFELLLARVGRKARRE